MNKAADKHYLAGSEISLFTKQNHSQNDCGLRKMFESDVETEQNNIAVLHFSNSLLCVFANNVVISSNVGKLDIFNASVENSALNNINNAIARFSIIKISSKNNGIGIIKKMIGTRIYNPSIKSVRFIMYLL